LKKFLIAFLFVFQGFQAKSQALEVGGGMDMNFFRGDLNPNFNPLLARPGGNIMVRYNFSRAFSIRANTSYGKFISKDKLSNNPLNESRNREFYGIVQDWDTNLEFNFLNFRSYGTIVKSSWTPILGAGIGQFRLPSVIYRSNGVQNSTDYDSPRLSFNYSFGFKKKINGNWNLTGTFKTFSPIISDGQDAYDGLGYKKDGTFTDSYIKNPADDPKTITPNTHIRDKFYHANITLSYVFQTLKCPNPKR